MGPACSALMLFTVIGGEDSLTSPAATRYPHITIPCGQVYDLPVGLSFLDCLIRKGELID
jgi:amidase